MRKNWVSSITSYYAQKNCSATVGYPMRGKNASISEMKLLQKKILDNGPCSTTTRRCATMACSSTTSRSQVRNFSSAQHVGNAVAFGEVNGSRDLNYSRESNSRNEQRGIPCNCQKNTHEFYHPVDPPMPLPIEPTQRPTQAMTAITHDNNNKSIIPNISNKETNRREHVCRDHFAENKIPFPPPLPEPKFSFYRRVLPQSLIQLSSPEGKMLFKESLLSETAESFFPLSEQFLNQSDPAFCGVTSLVMVLNAIGIDPNVRWKGGWRWYGSEEMILAGCCIDSERVKRIGITMEEYQSLGRCQGLQVHMKRPIPLNDDNIGGCSDESDDNDEKCEEIGDVFTIEEFRRDVKHLTQNPPIYEKKNDNDEGGGDNEEDDNDDPISEKLNGGFLVVCFARQTLGQTGDGHFSPIAAYHEPSDRCLILDVARFKYSPYWVSITDLYEAMKPLDQTTNKSRGWFMNHPPDMSNWIHEKDGSFIGYNGSKANDELKRPASDVPLFESGTDSEEACPVGKIKVEYCSAGQS